jgi:hypothetical protein
LRIIVARSREAVTVLSPYAGATLNGRNLRARNPRTQMHSLLYAQLLQADGKSWLNVLIGRSLGAQLPPSNDLEDPLSLPALTRFTQEEILATLRLLGLPLNSPLSVVSVETQPEEQQPDHGFVPLFADSLGSRLGQVRILRTSVLTPVPEICPPKTAV